SPMISRLRSSRRLPLNALALALGISFFSDAALAGDEQYATAIRPPSNGRPRKTIFDRHNDKNAGTLGYGPPGAFPGFQGFGIGYQRGYGYGGWGLGVGAEGGFPFYSGPGYPHPDPTLRRYGTTRPFPYFGGPGGPTAHCPNFYGDPGPLVADKPVITIGDDRYDTGFGQYTGAIPYPEAVLAPFTTSAAAGAVTTEEGSANPAGAGPNNPPSTGGNATMRIPDRSLGIDSEPVTD